jgi:hypothetical protein
VTTPGTDEDLQRTAASIEQAINTVVVERGWNLEQLHDQQIWSLNLPGEDGSYLCYLQVESDRGQVVFYGIVPAIAEETERVRTAVAIAAVNYGLAVGNFELDLSDGEMRFSTGIDVTGTTLDPLVFARMIDHTIDMLDAYTPVLREPPPLPEPLGA